jgi:plastocyanin
VSQLIDPTAPVARRVARGAAALAISVGCLTACGSDSSDDGAAAAITAAGSSSESAAPTTDSGSSSADSGTAQTIAVSEEDFSIAVENDSLSAGTYDITVTNDGNSTHNLVVERDGEDVDKTDEIQPGKSATLTVTLESGDYVFYCSIGAHRSMGMETDVSVS